ncbi:large conductance mechanosensitive channel protein MscL [Sutterella massiliensis]|uniref:Large-conductance mechanosensitive channel n=1 Tax=Sutterella massiliensis TaxID=1816689 RepID=A0ABS2DSM9_9BURK|nr:large conductance mechanosensitive channel protein MscL [Sutterella massiliensis]MBM6704356.1 large conductance mechanosensitive channel protein MscL [Sutterella massiliensis]
MRKFLSEFQAFISRGNVLDLAVAVIIGAAFSKIVDSLVKDIVNPILGVLVGRPDFTNLFIVLKPVEGYTGPNTYEALVKAGATVFGYGAFLTAVIQFLLLAFAVFWLIKIVMTARAKIAETAEKLLSDEKTAALEAEKAKAEEKAKEKAAEAEKKAKEDAAQAAIQAAAKKSDAETVALLTEIRDLLKKTA